VLTCPNCGQENQPSSAFCLRCGSALTTTPTPPGEEVVPPNPAWGGAVPTPAVSSVEYQLTHRGTAYGIGYGPTFYGVWDLRVGGSPAATFDRTPIGWEAAWRRYQELETKGGVRSWRQARPGWILLHILIAAAIWFLQVILVGVILVAANRDTERFSRDPDPAIGGAALLTIITSLAGWILFVYLRARIGVRWAVLLGLTVPAFALFVAISLANVPAAP
jgi:zinc-ribbon domain